MKQSWISFVALFISIAVLILAIFTFFNEKSHYEELIQPHTIHDEIYDKLNRLDTKIDCTEKGLPPTDNETNKDLESLAEARRIPR